MSAASVKLKKRSDLHWSRKIWHMSLVSLMAATYMFTPESISLTILAIACLIFIPLDFLRQKRPALNDFLVHLLRPFIRESEVNALAGTTYLLVGVAFVALLYPPQIVAMTLLFLAYADPLASVAGILWGKDKLLGAKSLQGSLTAFIVCSVIAAGFFYFNKIMLERIFIVSLVSGLAGAISELIPVGRLDDNLSFPILCATALWLIFSLFGGLNTVI